MLLLSCDKIWVIVLSLGQKRDALDHVINHCDDPPCGYTQCASWDQLLCNIQEFAVVAQGSIPTATNSDVVDSSCCCIKNASSTTVIRCDLQMYTVHSTAFNHPCKTAAIQGWVLLWHRAT